LAAILINVHFISVIHHLYDKTGLTTGLDELTISSFQRCNI